MVERERMEELLRELRLKTPEEIKRYQKTLQIRMQFWQMPSRKQKPLLLRQTSRIRSWSMSMRLCSRLMSRQIRSLKWLLIRHRIFWIMQSRDANEIRRGAIQYTDDMLANMQTMVQEVVETSNSRYSAMMKNFQDFYDTIISNRQELAPETASVKEETEETTEEPETDDQQ